MLIYSQQQTKAIEGEEASHVGVRERLNAIPSNALLPSMDKPRTLAEEVGGLTQRL